MRLDGSDKMSPKVKICGITNTADALAAVDAGANLLGFNFYEKSARYLAEGAAAKIRSQLPENVEAVGMRRAEVGNATGPNALQRRDGQKGPVGVDQFQPAAV